MESQWNDDDARATIEGYRADPRVNEDIALRVYTSRLIGRDPRLVLHGGGNTSVKTSVVDDTGHEVPVLCVKGSGWDLGDIEPEGLPAVRLQSLGALRERESLSDEEMVNAQRTRLIDSSAPNPSVETLLHAFLPHKFIDHSHADAILAIVDQPEAEAIAREIYGGRLAVVPYIMAGFDLAKLAAATYERDPQVEGLLLLKHGLFTFGKTARESYERHIAAVDAAERYISEKVRTSHAERGEPAAPSYESVAPILRGRLGEGARNLSSRAPTEPRDRRVSRARRPREGEPARDGDPQSRHPYEARSLAARAHAADGCLGGRCTRPGAPGFLPHGLRAVCRTRVRRQATRSLAPRSRPEDHSGAGDRGDRRGVHEKAARIAADVYEHTIDVIESAEAVGSYTPLDTSDLFDMEYWSLEQAKLGRAKPKAMQGRVVYISGAAGGIGAATAAAFASAGASLYLTDRDKTRYPPSLGDRRAPRGGGCERRGRVRASIEHCVEAFGGLDGVVSNAGTAPEGDITRLSSEELKRSFEINFFSHQYLASAAVAVFRAQAMGGFLCFNASKAAFNPGQGFGPYAVPKAALVALMKQYALEGGSIGVQSNAVNADRIRTGLLPDEVVARRAEARGLDADAYFRSNLLAREVSAQDVAEAFLHLALAQSTTGCVVTVDGGNIAASPR